MTVKPKTESDKTNPYIQDRKKNNQVFFRICNTMCHFLVDVMWNGLNTTLTYF